MTAPAKIAILGLVFGVVVACDSSEPKPAVGGGPVPAEFQVGEAKFKVNCAVCHGAEATGTDHGPALVHKIYEPNHHSDAAFQRAAANGVRAHHWGFGNMPKVEGVTPADVDHITQYIRWLQRQAGIF